MGKGTREPSEINSLNEKNVHPDTENCDGNCVASSPTDFRGSFFAKTHNLSLWVFIATSSREGEDA